MEKIRNVPHQLGNHPLFIYIPILSSNKYIEITKAIKSKLDNSTRQLEPINNYHLSLSSTYYPKLIEIDRLISTLQNTISKFKKFSIAITNQIKYFSNEYNNRFFIGLEIKKSKQLRNISKAIDSILIDFGFNEFIIPLDDKCYHISLLWDSTGKYDIDETSLNEEISKEIQVIKVIKVNDIKVKIGNKEYLIELR